MIHIKGEAGEVGKFEEEWTFFWTKEGGFIFLQTLTGGGVDVFHASHQTFNKCHKKAVLWKQLDLSI